MITYLDNTINPGDDFFKYTTNHWIDKNPKPDEYPNWNTFTKLYDDNIHKINDIIIHPDNTTLSKKINTYYNIITDKDKREKDGNTPVLSYLNNIRKITSRSKLIDFLARARYNIFFTIFIGIDDKDNDNYIVQLWQGGLSLGNKEYYTVKNENNKKIIKGFKKYVLSMFDYYGINSVEADARFRSLWKIENKIAKLSYSVEEEQEPSKNYHKYTVSEASKILNYNLKEYLNIYGYDATDIVNICQIEPIKLGFKFLEKLPILDLRWYLEYVIMDMAMNKLDDKAYDIAFEYSKIFSGPKEKMPLWKRAVNTINNVCDDAIGQIYIKKYFPEESKEKMEELVNLLIDSYSNIISEQTWMSNKTKKLALQKLKNMGVKIGYPNKFIDLTDIPIYEGISNFETSLRLDPYFFNIDKKRHYNKPVDKDEWGMSPQTVNAYYSSAMNEIVFPAGILQAPFFNPKETPNINFGAIGAVIGHEMTHGFDNHGRQYDIEGKLNNWWSEEDIKKFNKLTDITKNHFNSLNVLKDLKCNGSLTLGENLADYGGLKIAYNAMLMYYKKYNLKLSNNDIKNFFISFATIWAGINTEESIRQQTMNNEHSINYIRVNGTLQLFSPWYECFNITKKDKLYIAPDKRAKIW